MLPVPKPQTLNPKTLKPLNPKPPKASLPRVCDVVFPKVIYKGQNLGRLWGLGFGLGCKK